MGRFWTDLLGIAGGLMYLAVLYLFIQWVVYSFTATGNGPIKWAEGYRQMVCDYSDCEDGAELAGAD